MNRAHVGRRDVLGSLGLCTAALPFVPLLSAHAKDEGPCKRLLLVYTPDGTVHERWVPSGGVRDFDLSPILSPLEAFKEKIVVLDGVTLQAGGADVGDHFRNMAALWTGCRFDPSAGEADGYADGISVDQHIANRLAPPTAFDSLELAVQPETFGVSGAEARNRMIYAGPSSPITPEHDPSAAFDRLFAKGAAEQGELAALKARRGSTIDAVRTELNALSTKLGPSDKHKLEQHLDGIRQLEQALDHLSACSGDDPAVGLDPWDEGLFPEIGAAQMEILKQAFACDLTRIASLQWAHAGGRGTRHLHLGIEEYHHTLVHSGTADFKDRLEEIETWYAERFADLLGLLDSVDDPGGGTMLDNTLVVWGRDLGRGYGHNRQNTPFVLAGGAAGELDTGRFLHGDDAQHNRLLVSICQLMGLSDETFGDLDDGSGPLSGL